MIRLKEKGFTLIELMIVVAIIGILAAIAIPRFAQMIEKSREGATKGNLGAIRSAISIYYGDQEGIFPDDITIASSGGRFGTYLSEIPRARARPLGDSSNVAGVGTIPSSENTGWAYWSATGEAWCNSTATDTKGSAFTTY